MPKNEPTTPGELDRYKEQIAAITAEVVRLLFITPAYSDDIDRLQKSLDDIPPSIAAALSASIEALKKTIQIIRKNFERSQQISLFPEDEDEAMRAAALDAVPHLLSVIPRDHLMPNHKLVNVLTKDLVGAGKTYLKVSSDKAKKPIPIICDLAYDEEKIQIDSCRPLSEYDRNVYNAVTSLYVYGDQSHIMTPAMVYRAMTGMSATEKPSPQQIGAVTKSMDRMRCILAKVDCAKELKARRLPLNQGDYITAGRIETYLLTTAVLHIEAGGRVMRAYKIREPPILYAYSKALNQVLSVPAHLLDVRAVDAETGQITTNRISNTESRIAIKGYLLRRIEGMKNPKNSLVNHSISLPSYERDGRHHAGLYEIGGNAAPSRKDAGRIRDYITDALNYWKATGYIRGFIWKKAGKQIVSVEIQP